MKRKLIALLTATVCALSACSALAACGDDENGGNESGITENTKFDSIVSERVETAEAWSAAFNFGDVTSMSCRWVGEDSVDEYISRATFYFKDNKGYLTIDEGDERTEGYMYLDGLTLYSLRFDESMSKWVKQGKTVNLDTVCVQARMFDPLSQYCYHLNLAEKFADFTYDEDVKGYVYFNEYEPDHIDYVIKFYGGKLAAVRYDAVVEKEELLIFDIGRTKKINIPAKAVEA